MNGQIPQPPQSGQQPAPQQYQQPIQQQPIANPVQQPQYQPMAQPTQPQPIAVPTQPPTQQPQGQQSQKIDPKMGLGLKVEWGYVKNGVTMYHGTAQKDQFGNPMLNPDGTRIMKSYTPKLGIMGKHMKPGDRHQFKVLTDKGISVYEGGMYPNYQLYAKCLDANEEALIGIPQDKTGQAINLDLSKQAYGKISSLNPMKGDTLIISHDTYVDNTGAVRPVVNAEIVKVQGQVQQVQQQPPGQPQYQPQMQPVQQQPITPQPVYQQQPPAQQYVPPQQPMAQQPQPGQYQAPPVPQNMNTGNPNNQLNNSVHVDTSINPVPIVGVNPSSSLIPNNPPTQDELDFLRDYDSKVPVHHSPEHFIGCRFLRDCPNEPEVLRLKYLYAEHFCKTQIEKEAV